MRLDTLTSRSKRGRLTFPSNNISCVSRQVTSLFSILVNIYYFFLLLFLSVPGEINFSLALQYAIESKPNFCLYTV